jgi:DNA-directed RNA polymerase subunit RPC12/RpoP
MPPQVYVCNRCQALFTLPESADDAEGKCPECGSRQVERLNVSSCSTGLISPPAWQYKCHECGYEFQMPVPRGPTEERSRTCPKCHSRNIERLYTYESEACPPGG